jgi:hypothetical protein
MDLYKRNFIWLADPPKLFARAINTNPPFAMRERIGQERIPARAEKEQPTTKPAIARPPPADVAICPQKLPNPYHRKPRLFFLVIANPACGVKQSFRI